MFHPCQGYVPVPIMMVIQGFSGSCESTTSQHVLALFHGSMDIIHVISSIMSRFECLMHP